MTVSVEGVVWRVLGIARYRAGEAKAAVPPLETAERLHKAGDGTTRFFLALAHAQLGDNVQARKWYDRAVEWTRKNAPNDQELRRLHREAAKALKLPPP